MDSCSLCSKGSLKRHAHVYATSGKLVRIASGSSHLLEPYLRRIIAEDSPEDDPWLYEIVQPQDLPDI